MFSLQGTGSPVRAARQRLEFWRWVNTDFAKGQTIRIFPLSNWTELDIWYYIRRERIPVVPLYFA